MTNKHIIHKHICNRIKTIKKIESQAAGTSTIQRHCDRNVPTFTGRAGGAPCAEGGGVRDELLHLLVVPLPQDLHCRVEHDGLVPEHQLAAQVRQVLIERLQAELVLIAGPRRRQSTSAQAPES